MSRRKIFFISALCVAALIFYIFFFYAPQYQDKKRNTLISQQVTVSQDVSEFHNSIFIADLHADSLLWGRNLINHNSYGHIDLPRMLEGNIGLQVFSVVTKTPRNLNLLRNSDSTDNITLLAIVQRWPATTWNNLYERAIYQSKKLHTLQKESPIPFYIIKYRDDLIAYLAERRANNNLTAGLLSLEGAHALNGKLKNVDQLFDAGFRIIGFTHFFDNRLGGSAHGIQKGGITKFGVEVLKRMEKLGILADISHASPMLVSDIINHSSKPVIATHTGVKHICRSSPRNLTDEQIRQIAYSKGLIGIGFWPNAVCTNNVQGIVDSIRHVVNLVGEDYVALGSDFDGNVQTPFDGAHIQTLTNALLEANFTRPQIEKIMGENVKMLLLENLPISLTKEKRLD